MLHFQKNPAMKDMLQTVMKQVHLVLELTINLIAY